jgi:ankyrin repeat protein
MFQAIRIADIGGLLALLDKGCDPNALNPDWGCSDHPLQIAAGIPSHSRFEIVRALLHAGANPDHQGEFGSTALHAVVCDDGRFGWKTAGLLLASGARTDLMDDEGLVPAEVAMMFGGGESVRVLLELGMDANTAGRDGPLILNCTHWGLGLTRELLARHADVHAIGRCLLDTALHRATESLVGDYCDDAEALIELLLGHGANLHAQDRDGRTPAKIAGSKSRVINAELERDALMDHIQGASVR